MLKFIDGRIYIIISMWRDSGKFVKSTFFV